MASPLLQGINHAALAARDFDATVAFYSEVFGLVATDLGGEQDRNAFLFFDNGTFLHVVDSPGGVDNSHEPRDEPHNLIYHSAPLDHVALFAVDVPALVEIRDRLASRGSLHGDIEETGGVVKTLRFEDPDGRLLEVSAYL